jgi:hypothetical protein
MLTPFKKGCSISLQSGPLVNSVVFATMILLIFSSITIISIISVTPIVMLAIGELGSGQRDIIIHPRMNYINASKITELGGLTAMPRIQEHLMVNANVSVMGWFMDLTLER